MIKFNFVKFTLINIKYLLINLFFKKLQKLFKYGFAIFKN